MYTVWLLYSEGWHPNDFNSKDECIDFISRNDGGSRDIRITKSLSLSINE